MGIDRKVSIARIIEGTLADAPVPPIQRQLQLRLSLMIRLLDLVVRLAIRAATMMGLRAIEICESSPLGSQPR